MLVLITYDVSTETEGGKKRLRKVAKVCTNYGIRVQNSVFECIVDSAKLVQIKDELSNIIDIKKDSLRFYYLGKQYEHKVEHMGTKKAIRVDQPLIF
ncbi:MAG: CRISPR-associated endonuclease Cas2 [Eubacteriales bacterium]